ncbi:uncharacterized protein LOC124654681 [Lolium rigidum]|uniref:uncharacterized protein LOC124654681 n=1 Tax=Lolium rigidum TaxID=89674 RepID=UPI001F5C58B7|nr:uncharacterized protein LOC124654681 [Lolium rigidum]
MPSTGSLESRATLAPGSKRNRRGTSTTAPTLGVTTRSRSQSARTKLDGAGEADGCRKRKLGGRVSPERSKKGKSILEHSQESLSWMDDDDDDDGGSSAVSSPIRVPYKPEETNCDSELAKVYRQFYQKVVRHNELPTLYADHPPNFLVDDSTLLHIREPARKMVLRAAQFVVGISSSIDGEPLAQCSGFWIDFDNESRTGTVVTTALLIRTKHPTHDPWFCKDQYASDAKVNVHLRGYITVEGDLLYYQKHYNLAFLRIRVEKDQSVQLSLPSYSDNVECAQDIFELGRDKHSDLLINHGRVEYSNPTKCERHHHMYIQGPQRDRMYDKGGPVVDLDGKVVGMICNYSRASFIPSSILLKCFHLWRNFRRIPRPHLGLQFNAISLLNPAHAEQISVVCGVDEGLVVQEVSGDSAAEKCGIRIGDVIECINGKSIPTTVELENMLLSIIEKSGDGLNSDLDLKIQVYCTRRNVRRVKVLTVNVSDDGEYCVPYCMPLPAGCVVTRPRNSPHRVSPGQNSVTPNEELSTRRKERR